MKNVLIVGGSNAISQEIIKKLPKEVNIVAVSIQEDSPRHEKLMNLSQENLHKEIFDITKDGDSLNWVDNLIKKYGKFDGCVYMPGKASFKSFEEITPEVFNEGVMYHGTIPYFLAKKLIPGMRQARQGRFVYISSNAAIKGLDRSHDYFITKAMIGQVAKNITATFKDENITATALMYGPINMHEGRVLPEGVEFPTYSDKDRVLTSQEAAEFIIYLLSPTRRGFAGTTLMMDTGRDAIAGIC